MSAPAPAAGEATQLGGVAVPEFKLLKSDLMRGRLAAIRAAVGPILAGNLLRNFTDHSVAHSDQVCNLIDQLAAPAEPGLNDVEAFALYAAAYLHDVGMQHERCGETETMRRVLAAAPHHGRPFDDLDESTRRELLRRHHNRVSAEMVRGCVGAAQPTVLGVQLTREDRPAYVASLCEAHTEPTSSTRYGELTADAPGVRMPLLAALLRLADILDETQRRTKMHLELTVRLDAESRMHWWRHYYVADVELRPGDRSVTLWFEFPPDRRDEYTALVPELQRPWIAAELDAHRGVLAPVRADWHLAEARIVGPDHATSRAMPDEVQLRMLGELGRRRVGQEVADRLTAVRRLDQAHALVARQLADLRDESVPALERLRGASAFAEQLAACGGTRGATDVLIAAHAAFRGRAAASDLLPVARRLGELLLADGQVRRAHQTLLESRSAVDGLPPGDGRRPGYLVAWARSLLAVGAIGKAAEAFNQLGSVGGANPEVLAELGAEVAEARLAAGEGGP